LLLKEIYLQKVNFIIQILYLPTRLIQGEVDKIVPMSQGDAYAAKAKAAGEDVKVVTIKGGGHFDMVSPYSAAWKAIKTELKLMMNDK